jgi:hypothetical protein
MGKMVPDAFAFAFFVPGALDLEGRGGSAPQKILREFQESHSDLFFRKDCLLAVFVRRQNNGCIKSQRLFLAQNPGVFIRL